MTRIEYVSTGGHYNTVTCDTTMVAQHTRAILDGGSTVTKVTRDEILPRTNTSSHNRDIRTLGWWEK